MVVKCRTWRLHEQKYVTRYHLSVCNFQLRNWTKQLSFQPTFEVHFQGEGEN